MRFRRRMVSDRRARLLEQQCITGRRQSRPHPIVTPFPKGNQSVGKDKQALLALGQVEELSEEGGSEYDIPIKHIIGRMAQGLPGDRGGEGGDGGDGGTECDTAAV